MALGVKLLLNMFGRPRGIFGRLGGVMMARMNEECGAPLSTKDSNSRFDCDAANAGPPHFPADRGAEDLRQLECRGHP